MTNGDWIRSLDDDALAKWLDIFDMAFARTVRKAMTGIVKKFYVIANGVNG